MVAKQTQIDEAARQIEGRLWDFVQNRSSDVVELRPTDSGYLWAIVGTDAFKGMNIVQRQDLVWQFLRKSVPAESLGYLTRVHTMDHAEFDRSWYSIDDANGDGS